MMPRRTGGVTAQGRSLVVALLLVLGVSCVLAWQAWDAARSTERVTAAALREYAGFAAWELRRRVEANASLALNSALIPALSGRVMVAGPPPAGSVVRGSRGDTPRAELAAVAASARSALHACACEETASDFFSIELGSGRVEVHEPELGQPFLDWLGGAFLEHARARIDSGGPGGASRRAPAEGRMVVLRNAGADNVLISETPVRFGPAHTVVYASLRRDDGRHVYGFAVDGPAFTRALIAAALAGPSLLPPSLARPSSNDELLTVAVRAADGDVVFRTGAENAGGLVHTDTFRLPTGPIVASVAVHPAIAGRLLIGGVPRSRVPMLGASLGVAVALLVIALLQLRRQQEFVRLRSDFVSGVSHELRTPLAQIRLFADLLASGRLDEGERARSLRILTDETRRLTYIADNVLRFSRSEHDTERLAPQVTEVRRFLDEVVEDFRPLAQARGAAIDLQCEPDVRGTFALEAMRQVLLNLLDNAVKYGPTGQTIVVAAHTDGDGVRFEVSDEGPGIPAESSEEIWQPYVRLTRDVAGPAGGSGIGLAVVRDIVKRHGGRARVTATERGGSRFVVVIPHV